MDQRKHPTEQLIGLIIAGRFHLVAEAGKGGMGTVYRAHDLTTGQEVAVKIMDTPRGDASQDGDRFMREAQLLSLLVHANIVRYVAHGQLPDGQRYLAMEWLDGEDLAQRLQRGPLAIADVLVLGIRIAEALESAHQKQVIHRDLKPTNIFLLHKEIGNAKLLDFGIARRLNMSQALTHTGTTLGTPAYMSPEQARDNEVLTEESDIFSLGCVLYECLTGVPPFGGEQLAAIMARLFFEDLVPVGQRRTGVPRPLIDLLDRMLLKDRHARIKSAGEVATLLRQIVPEKASGGEITHITGSPLASGASTDGEMTLLSLVLATLPMADSGEQGEVSSGSVRLPADVTVLRSELQALGGHIELILGGGLVTTVPQLGAAGDQAMLALRCGELIRKHWPLSIVAVATGRGARSRGMLTGEVLTNAWRLVAAAQRLPSGHVSLGDVLVDDVSASLLERTHQLEALSPVSGAFVVRAAHAARDQERLLLGKPTECLGRDAELATLERLFEQCADEQVLRTVLVLAPPGLGKSRLRHEFLRRLQRKHPTFAALIGRGDPMKSRSAYGVLADAVRHHCGITDTQAPTDLRARLNSGLGLEEPLDGSSLLLDFLAELCGLHMSTTNNPVLRAAQQNPRIMTEQIEQAWFEMLRRMSKAAPLIILLDDVHWSDPLTIRLLELTVRRLREQSIMLLALGRPEILESHPNLWAGMVHLMPLHPLPRRVAERLVKRALGAELPGNRVAEIVDQAGGNPLFLEELIRAGAQQQTGKLPETVAAIIQARLSRLPQSVRRVLRAASVFGQSFPGEGVTELLASFGQPELVRDGLQELIREEIIEMPTQPGSGEHATYRFRQTMVRDAAYELLAPDEAITWHALAAQHLVAAGLRNAVILAEHFRLGNRLEQAGTYYAQAAEDAFDVGGIEAAQALVERGLALRIQAVDRGTLMAVRVMIGAWNSQYVECFELGLEAIGLLIPGSRAWSRVYYGVLTAAAFVRPAMLSTLIEQFMSHPPATDVTPIDITTTAEGAMLMLLIGERRGAERLASRVEVYRKDLAAKEHLAWCHLHALEYSLCDLVNKQPAQACQAGLLSMEEARESKFFVMQFVMGGFYGRSLMDMGQHEKALRVLQENLSTCERIKHDGTGLDYARMWLAYVLATCGETTEALQQADALCTQLLTCVNPSLIGITRSSLSRLAVRRGDLETAINEAQAACQILAFMPPLCADPAALLARLLLRRDSVEQALAVCEERIAILDKLQMQPYGWVALLTVHAQAQEKSGATSGAQATARRALGLLREHLSGIDDAAERQTFLHAVPEHVDLVELGSRLGLDVPREPASAHKAL